ncbi:hypothetical protein Pcinc_042148 [Petrolisthes cinctipes]|uniref:Uncharacterized protein n=1 Tax=Petrolisthes cinctipes TaxID=88211 RepID=A0AAE1EJ50_PETCI|nr:hypothetical protein Pcinc_042148 [Petrolisthes cinctipes]
MRRLISQLSEATNRRDPQATDRGQQRGEVLWAIRAARRSSRHHEHSTNLPWRTPPVSVQIFTSSGFFLSTYIAARSKCRQKGTGDCRNNVCSNSIKAGNHRPFSAEASLRKTDGVLKGRLNQVLRPSLADQCLLLQNIILCQPVITQKPEIVSHCQCCQ